MNPNLPVSARDAARELTNVNSRFVSAILEHLYERYAQEPLIGETSDETLRRVYRRDGKLEVVNYLKDLFYPKGQV